jgi:hypothetical protein
MKRICYDQKTVDCLIQDRLLADTFLEDLSGQMDHFTHENVYADLLRKVGDWISKSFESVYGILLVWLLRLVVFESFCCSFCFDD